MDQYSSNSSDEDEEAIRHLSRPHSARRSRDHPFEFRSSLFYMENTTLQDYAQAHFGDIYRTTVHSRSSIVSSDPTRLVLIGFCGGIACVWLGIWTSPHALHFLEVVRSKVVIPLTVSLIQKLFQVDMKGVHKICLIRGPHAEAMECFPRWSLRSQHADLIHAALGLFVEFGWLIYLCSATIVAHYQGYGGTLGYTRLPWPFVSTFITTDFLRLPFQKASRCRYRPYPSRSKQRRAYVSCFLTGVIVVVGAYYFQADRMGTSYILEFSTFLACLETFYTFLVNIHAQPKQMRLWDVMSPWIEAVGKEYCLVSIISVLIQAWRGDFHISTSETTLALSYRLRSVITGSTVSRMCEPLWPQDYQLKPLASDPSQVLYLVYFRTSRCPILNYFLTRTNMRSGGEFSSDSKLVEIKPMDNPDTQQWLQKFAINGTTLLNYLELLKNAQAN